MAYDICKKCQRFFKKTGKSYCKKCDEELNLSRKKIDEYLETNPHASIIEIVKEADVCLKDVNIFLELGGALPYDNKSNMVNLRKEELKEREELLEKRESLKLTNKFKPRRLRD